MNLRVKEIRKHFGFTQKDFANQLGIVQSAVSYMEKSGATVTEQNIKLITSRFNINENWLRTGEGEMFNSVEPDEELAYLMGKILASENDFVKHTMLALAKLDKEEWTFIENLIKKIKDGTN